MKLKYSIRRQVTALFIALLAFILGGVLVINSGFLVSYYLSHKTEELVKGSIESGKEYTITYVIDEKGLNDAIGLELVTTYTAQDGKQHIYSVEPFNVVKKDGNLYTFQAKHKLENAGSFKVSYRMFPKNPDLPHRQDFCYVRWFI